MKDESKKASPELIQQMKNIQAQAEAAKHWLSKKRQKENLEREEKDHEKEMASIENEINNL